jgi:hypothetical protein
VLAYLMGLIYIHLSESSTNLFTDNLNLHSVGLHMIDKYNYSQ